MSTIMQSFTISKQYNSASDNRNRELTKYNQDKTTISFAFYHIFHVNYFLYYKYSTSFRIIFPIRGGF